MTMAKQAAGEDSAAPAAEVDSKPHGVALQVQHLAGKKLSRKLSSSLQESVSTPVSDFAVRQLQKMGWREGTGLGKKRDGMKTHVKVIKRQDSAGLGTERQAAAKREAEAQWWQESLGDTLEKLAGSSKKSKKNKKKQKKVYTDEELFEATGGARFGMRAGKTRNLAKWRRTESDLTDFSSTAVVSSGADHAAAESDSSSNGASREGERPQTEKKTEEKCSNSESEAEKRRRKKEKRTRKKEKKRSRPN
jgi:Pin2-interacting protein X1